MPEAEVVWYWDNTHSFTENEHSLANWLKGKTANAYINENGYLEVNVEPSGFPNTLSSPDLEAFIFGKKFDAIRILYLNSIEYPRGKAKGMIGWLDDTMADNRRQPKDKVKKKGMIEFPLDVSSNFKWKLIILKKHPDWERKAQALGLTFSPAFYNLTARGKFLIWRIELIKIR